MELLQELLAHADSAVLRRDTKKLYDVELAARRYREAVIELRLVAEERAKLLVKLAQLDEEIKAACATVPDAVLRAFPKGV